MGPNQDNTNKCYNEPNLLLENFSVGKDLIINATGKSVEIALLEDKALVELHQENNTTQFSVGDICLGIVKRIVPGLNAAFVDVGFEKDAFLHYTDLGPNVPSFLKFVSHTLSEKQNSHLLDDFTPLNPILKNGEIGEAIKRKQRILVQIIKEPISTKGPRLTSEISFPGRFVVLTPFNKGVNVSKKIDDDKERERLKKIGADICPANFGLIIRTAAVKKTKKNLEQDLANVLKNWKEIFDSLKSSNPPEKVHSEISKTSSLMRDLLTEDFNRVIVNDKNIANEIKNYIIEIAPDKKKIVEYYNSRLPIFDNYNVSKQIKSSFGQIVNMKTGAYLVIEHTEAMHVIDVNSGFKKNNKIDQAAHALTVNLEAAAEIARQLRLRDIGGLVVIDFIDMKDAENKKMVYRRVRELMEEDRARHTILPLSKFCLMQITRQRVKPVIEINTAEVCPSCHGTGKIKPTILLIDEIKANYRYLSQDLGFNNLSIKVHPFVGAFFKKGMINEQLRWFWEFKKWLTIVNDSECAITEYQFLDDKGDTIKLSS